MASSVPRSELRVATITVSDTRTVSDDEGGRKLRALLAGEGFALDPHHIVPDDPNALRTIIVGCESAHAIVTTGGTGIAPRDQTYEAIEEMLEKRLDGFGEAFRRLSWDAVGARAILSRAVAGTFRGRILAALPGNPAALELAVIQVLAPVLSHAVALARGEAGHHRPAP